jgi:hypothetical protein
MSFCTACFTARSVANVLFSALTLSCAIIGLHGATRVPDDLFLDEADVSVVCFEGLQQQQQQQQGQQQQQQQRQHGLC